jgi:hypothetical protein
MSPPELDASKEWAIVASPGRARSVSAEREPRRRVSLTPGPRAAEPGRATHHGPVSWAKAWPDAELRVVGGTGHPEDDEMRTQILGALAFEDGHS